MGRLIDGDEPPTSAQLGHRTLGSSLLHTTPRQLPLRTSARSFSAAREATRGGSAGSTGPSLGSLLVFCIRRGADDAEVLRSRLKLLSSFSMLGVVQ